MRHGKEMILCYSIYKAAARAMTARARPRPAVTRPLPLMVAGRREDLGVKLPVPEGAAVTREAALVVAAPVGAVTVAVAGTRPTELPVPVPVVKATWGTVISVLMMMVELELAMVEPAESVQGTTVVTLTVTVV